MDNAGFSGKPPEFPNSHEHDIPEALRETSEVDHRPPIQWGGFRGKGPFLWGLVGLAIALFAGILLNSHLPLPLTDTTSFIPAEPGLQPALIKARIQVPGSLLGHLPYEEAPTNTLQLVTADGKVKLRQAAAARFLEMAAAARSNGIALVPLSGFRSIADQEYLFFNLQAQQGEGPTKRAEVSAPPGYSEHHTGYAIDVIDGDRPDTDLQISFETSASYQWLQENAAHFNFELSFPMNNAQGVSYEPWHWRFVGDRNSLETFYKARTLLGN